MKINKRSSKKTYITVTAIIVVAILVSGGAYALMKIRSTKNHDQTTSNIPSTPTVNLDKPTAEQIQAGENRKKESLESDAQPSPSPQTLGVTITAANQNPPLLQIRTLINTILGSGTCTLTLTKDTTTITRTASVQALASSSTCQGFDISLSDLSTGKWSIEVSVTSGSLSGKATSEVTI